MRDGDVKEAKDCIANGGSDIVGSTVPTFTPPPVPSPSPKPAQFFESKPAPEPSPAVKAAAKPPVSSTPVGLDAVFPDGEIDCDKVPTQFGPVALPWLGRNGWAGFMDPDMDWTPGVMFTKKIHQPLTLTPPRKSFCTYACPPGYMVTQWPVTSQGSEGQSVGGLYCGTDNKLYKTNPAFNTLCTPGAGGVEVRNEMSEQVCICKTIYPGSESPDEPYCVQPGQTIPLTNLDATKAYKWQGKETTGQFYINLKGLGPEDACLWENPKYPGKAGNWAPDNLGIGQNPQGETFIGLFRNLPTTSAMLDFDVVIEGDVSSACYMRNNQYPSGNGCTTAISRKGGKATVVLKNKGSN